MIIHSGDILLKLNDSQIDFKKTFYIKGFEQDEIFKEKSEQFSSMLGKKIRILNDDLELMQECYAVKYNFKTMKEYNRLVEFTLEIMQENEWDDFMLSKNK